ncbi:DUF5988 family protein [Streptomyces coeruleorubidus]|uniref:DUF5988 family protein n=1 Tax=Streptomyces coeruleorubidus TaxID=116188 RepID=UPI0036C9D272
MRLGTDVRRLPRPHGLTRAPGPPAHHGRPGRQARAGRPTGQELKIPHRGGYEHHEVTTHHEETREGQATVAAGGDGRRSPSSRGSADPGRPDSRPHGTATTPPPSSRTTDD